MRPSLHCRFRRARGALIQALVLAGAAIAAAQPGPEAQLGPALERVPEGAEVLHCAVAKGVLYLSYALDGRAAIAPARHTPTIHKACAAAGYPLATDPPGRSATPLPRIGIGTPGAGGATRPGRVVEPSFSVQASGSSISIDGRNDSDVAFHCVINFAWTADGEPGGSRGVTTQATLPARQSNRVVFIAGPYRNMRLVGLPRWDCRPSG